MHRKFYLVAALAASLGMAGLTTTQAATAKTTTTTSTSTKTTSSKATKDKEQEDIKPASVINTTDLSDEPMPYHMKKGYIYSDSGLTKTLGSAKDFDNVTFYAYKKVTIDRSAQGSGNSVFYYVRSGSGKQTGYVWHGNLEGIAEGTFNIAMKNSNYFKANKIITMGDSITCGYDGYQTLDDMGYPTWLSRYLNAKVTNVGYNGAFLSQGDGNAETPGDLNTVINEHNFKNYNVATIAYGTNDYGHSTNSLDDIKTQLNNDIKKMKSDNKNLIIYGILPLTRYDSNVNSDEVPGQGGYTMNQLRDAEAEVFKDNSIPYLDWRNDTKPIITDANHIDRFNDGRLHPNPMTYQLMGREIAQFMIKNYPEDMIKTTSKTSTTKKATTSKTTAKKTTAKTSSIYRY
ncbi:SGNH/GDSL hydrolase family protein [Lentilactobacillus sp. TOM.63]|uniref:SGNH/GDSL hydrolase family protein n=1 Tax=Lentilactobacillus TaxID=2767893 RepID=UPI001C27E5B6|nr:MULTISPECIES: SGNH/GDSL hydrolase family protein [Lentilactobacillus]MBU9790292.1 SGNH/GDSL hydrolase family protein [Lentilactobacillus dabitei]MDM7516694.1 SGNH/GDSL hydrolase family protein [Lentilactobacillus sp. TOM.63]